MQIGAYRDTLEVLYKEFMLRPTERTYREIKKIESVIESKVLESKTKEVK